MTTKTKSEIDYDDQWDAWCEKDDIIRGDKNKVSLEYGRGMISIHSPYNKKFISEIKQIKQSFWNSLDKCWSIPSKYASELDDLIRECYK